MSDQHRTTITDARITAIRSDDKVGRGSCSTVDECYSDADLVAALNDARISLLAVRTAIKWAHQEEEMHLEQALNARWGDDDDPQLEAYRNWKDNA